MSLQDRFISEPILLFWRAGRGGGLGLWCSGFKIARWIPAKLGTQQDIGLLRSKVELYGAHPNP